MSLRILAPVLLAALPLAALASTPINETRQLDPRGTVEISNLKGSILVRTWDKPQVRIGAIYVLERLARESADDRWPIVALLCAYVRERAAWEEERPDGARVGADVQTALLFAITVGPNTQFWLERLDLGHPPGFEPQLDVEVDPDPTLAGS